MREIIWFWEFLHAIDNQNKWKGCLKVKSSQRKHSTNWIVVERAAWLSTHWKQISAILIYLNCLPKTWMKSVQLLSVSIFYLFHQDGSWIWSWNKEKVKYENNRVQNKEWWYTRNEFPIHTIELVRFRRPFFVPWPAHFSLIVRAENSLTKGKGKDLKNGTMQTFRIYYHLESAKA